MPTHAIIAALGGDRQLIPRGCRSRLNVIALRRAFLLAGARALVTCQWHVTDGARLELLEEFYRRFLAGQGCADALREARLALKARGVGANVWGAFVGHGDPGWEPPAA
ncbi:MAG: CHAT domain-containing protein [Gemmataceae bacterium]|nr:CHAT domain-containing protein [Gemmataceae bacterium]